MSKLIVCSRMIRRLASARAVLVLATVALIASEARGGEAAESGALWTVLDGVPVSRSGGEAWVRPQRFQAVILDVAGMRNALSRAPMESAVEPRRSPLVVALPMPDGTFSRFGAVESPVMAPELAARYPQIRTYLGQGIDDPTAVARFDLTQKGFHGQILRPSGAVYIDPYTRGDVGLYTSYHKADLGVPDFHCLGLDEASVAELQAASSDGATPRVTGETRREYRLAVAATGEYTTFWSSPDPANVADGLAGIVTSVNRVTGVYELEIAVRLILVANNDLIVYTNGTTDPYSNTNGSSMLSQNQTNLTNVIGSANYDFGHVFSTGGGGIASLNSVCSSSNKARGVTGRSAPTGDAFDIDYVAHEMGHQLNANHSFNGSTTNCGSNRNASTAYEPGSGTTIMSYAGVCAPADNIQLHSDAYFHAINLLEISNYVTSGTGSICGTAVATGNHQPTVNAGPDYTIPSGTPFVLTASGSDPDGDAVTYCWEELDLGPAQPASGASSVDNGSSPIFRSYSPKIDPSRTCPALNLLLANQLSTIHEKLPATNRTLRWRCTIRDNRAAAGGTNSDDMNVTVTTAGGAFSVTSPNTAVTWSGVQTVTWNTAGTAGAPVNTATVNIRLSTDGGITYPTMLAAATENDGTEQVTLPNLNTTTARIKVEAVGNIFFDISNANFAIVPAVPQPPSGLNASVSPVCPNGQVDLAASVGPNEIVDWYTDGCGVTFVNSGSPIQVTPSVTTTYHARARDLTTAQVSATCATVVVAVYSPGDTDASGATDAADVPVFVDMLLGLSPLPSCAGDMDGDGDVDGNDLVLFVPAIIP